MPGWPVALLAATALHAGFQATVTLVVYPALARVGPADWTRAHGDHSRRIAPLVAVVYGALLVSCVGAALRDPASLGVWLAVLGTAGALLATALAAAPTHGRLTDGADPALLTRLLRADRLRLAFALLALAGAVLAVR